MSFTVSRESNLPPRSVYDYQQFRNRSAARQTTVVASESSAIDTIVSATTPSTAVCATTANHGLSGLSAVDGVTPVVGDRVLVWKQTTPSENGVYLAASGAWTRAIDPIYAGSVWEVLQGTLYGNRQIICTNDADPVIGTDAITFAVRPGGVGTGNKLARWTSTATLGDSLISDDGTRVQLGSSATTGIFNVERNTSSGAVVYARNTATSGNGTAGYYQTDSSASNSYATEHHATGGGSGLYAVATGSGNGIDVSVVDGFGVSIVPTGTGIGLNVNRNNASATNPVAQVIQDNGSGAQNAVEIRNDSTNAAATALYTLSTGGIAGFFESGTNASGYFYRNNASATAPTCVVWQDSATDVSDAFYVRNDGTGNTFVANVGGTNVVEINSSGTLIAKEGLRLANTRSVTTSPTTLDATDCIVLVDTSAVTHAVTLPAVADGRVVTIKDKANNAGTRNITINRGGTSLIDGATSKTINTNYGALRFVSDGTNWFLI